jgi:hypothetical protein
MIFLVAEKLSLGPVERRPQVSSQPGELHLTLTWPQRAARGAATVTRVSQVIVTVPGVQGVVEAALVRPGYTGHIDSRT